MITVDFTSSPDMPIASAPVLGRGRQDRRDRLLDAQVDHGVAVVGEDDVDEVLADVVHVALTVASTIVPLPSPSVLLHVRLEVRDGRLHHLGRREHERQLHLAGAEQLADGLHARQQRVVDDLQRGPGLQRLVQVGLQAVPLAVDDPPLQPLEQRQRGQLLGPPALRRRRRDALEQLHEPVERVVALAAAVVDEVERHRALLVGDLGHRQDLRRRDDGGVEARVHALVQEHRVQHLPRGRVEPERDVGDAQRGLHVRVAALELADRLDGLQRVAAHLLLPGGDREGEVSTTMSDSCMPWLPVRSSMSRSATRTFHSAVRAWPSSSMQSATTAAPCSSTSSIARW